MLSLGVSSILPPDLVEVEVEAPGPAAAAEEEAKPAGVLELELEVEPPAFGVSTRMTCC